MTSKLWLTIMSIYALLSGLGALLAPEAFMAPLGAETDAVGILNLRYFGAVALGLATIMWRARKGGADAVRPVLTGGLVTFVLAAIVGATGAAAAGLNAMGWGVVGVDALAAAGFAWTLLATKAVKPAAPLAE